MRRKPANLARAIYGNVLATSLVAAFSEDDDYSTTEIAVSVLVTGLVFWLAHVYSSLLAERYAVGRRLTRSETGAEFYSEWPVVQAFFPPVIVLLLGTIGLLSRDTAIWLAIAAGLGALVIWSLEIGHREQLSLLELAVMTFVNALFGLVIVLLKTLVH
jgi:hypothetical protein